MCPAHRPARCTASAVAAVGRSGIGRSAKSGLLGLAVVALAAVLSGCGGSSPVGSADPQSDGGLTIDINGNGAAIAPADIAGWPSTAPADVPAFPGHIDNLMVGRRNGNGYGVRIFFSGVTKDKFGAYVGVLRSAGYKVQGVVYYTDIPGVDSNSNAQARAARGEYDAAKATKDPRRMNINVPGTDGTVTYDLDGLTKDENDAMNFSPWPAGWADKVPAPDNCKLDSRSILGSNSTGFRLYCIYTATDQASRDRIAKAYVAALQAKGFKDTGSNSGGSYNLSNGSYEVAINPDQGGNMYIEATTPTSMTNGWPSDWVARVPPPDGCTLAAELIASMPTGFNAACTYPDNDPSHRQQVVATYKAKLQAAGFTLDTSGDSSGMPLEEAPVNLVKGSIKVNIIPNGAPDGMSISGSQGD
jgi:hypothetical protein